jgi:integrase
VARKREVYAPDEVRRVLRACADTPTGHRDRLAIMLLWTCGLRPVELHALTLSSIDLRAGVVEIPGHEYDVRVPGSHRDELRKLLRRWKRARRSVANEDSPLLCSLHGTALDPSYLRRVLPELARDAGLDRRMHAQGLRNTFAFTQHMKHVPMELIRRQLGHTDIEYTARFLARISQKEQKAAMADFSLE